MIARQVLNLRNLVAARTFAASPAFKFCETKAFEQENRNSYSRVQKPKFKKAAIILSGAGIHDGSEVTEVVSLMIHLNKMFVDFECFVPNEEQLHVVNHNTGEVTQEKRNALVEAARITRGKVRDIKELKGEDFQAVLIPGGFGVAKNLSDYASNGGSFSVHAEVERIINEFHSQQKPIGAMCISPILLAKVLSEQKPKITLGRKELQDSKAKYWPHSGAIAIAESLGAEVKERNIDKIQIDFNNKIVTTPAFMFDGYTKVSGAFEGIGSLCTIVQKLVQGNYISIELMSGREKSIEQPTTSSSTQGERQPYRKSNSRFNEDEN